MTHITSDSTNISDMARLGSQPITLAAGALLLIVLGIGVIGSWRAYSSPSFDQDRVAEVRQLQLRATQASEQIAQKTRGLEVTQQQSIDQLQVVQDQLQTVKRQLATQKADAKRLSDQLSGLTEAIDALRQSFASAQTSEPSSRSAVRERPGQTRSHAARSGHRRHHRS